VAFELELHPVVQIHPIFHVSKHKLFHNQNETPQLEPSSTIFNNQPKLQPLIVLDWRISGNCDAAEALGQWQDLYLKMPLGRTVTPCLRTIQHCTLRARCLLNRKEMLLPKRRQQKIMMKHK